MTSAAGVVDIRWLTLFLDLAGDTGKSEQFWLIVTGTRPSTRRGPDGEFATLVPPHGDAYLRVQRVRGGTGGCHLDMHVDRAAMTAAATGAVTLGARERFREDGLIVLDSPGGFPFCFVGWENEETVPEPFDASRLDQVCVDAPPGLFDAEFDFWTALTGWEARSSTLPEFRSLARPAGIPVRLLFQRTEAVAKSVTGHVDFSCTDRKAVMDRHTAAGARTVATFPHWTTMADPTGRPYCLTDRNPMTGTVS